MARVCFHGRKWVHTRLSEKDRTQRLTRRSRGLPFLDTAGLCVTSEISLITAFVTIDSTVLLYTYISQFSVAPHYQQQLYLRPPLVVFFNFSHKRPTFAFTPESGYTLGFAQRIAHSGLHAETGGISDGALSLPSTRTARSRTSPVRVPERRALPLLGLGRGYSQRTQRAFGTAMRLCASLSRGVAAPLGCVIFFHFCRNCDLYAIRACARWGWYHYPQRALRAVETPDGRLPKGLICRFLRLPSSTPCAVTFSANTQISLSVISVANVFALWYDKSHKSGLFGDKGEPE